MSEATPNPNNNDPGAQPPATPPITPPADDSQVKPPADSLLGGEPRPPADGQDSDDQEQDAPVIPETPEDYKFEFAAETQVDEALLGKFQQWAHTNKVPVEVAAHLAKEFESHVAAQLKAQPEMWAKAIEQRREDFRKQLMADQEFGQDVDNNIAAMDKGFNEFAAPGLKDLLVEHGLNTHPAVVKTFLSIGKALAEPDFVGGNNAAKEKSAAEVLYPSNN